MTNAEKRARRQEAARKAAETRRARQAEPEVPEPEPEPVADTDPAPTARDLLEFARSIGREADLWYHAHHRRLPTRPTDWAPETREEMETFLRGFIRPDGTPQPVTRRGRKRR
jgi:hypothetical protein